MSLGEPKTRVLVLMVSDHLIDGGGIGSSLASQTVRSMPRRPAKVTQGEIARVIRAAKEAGAAEVITTVRGKFVLCYHQMCLQLRRSHLKRTTTVQSGQCPCLQERNGGHLGMPLLGRIFQNTYSDLELCKSYCPIHFER
jgi:hypothetical protein